MELYKAKLGDWELRLLTITDDWEHSLVMHEFIGYDGARIDDMGLRARTITFRAYFFGNSKASKDASYLNWFPALQQYLNSQKQITLIHPTYGTILGRIQSVIPVSDDTRSIAVDITFTEDGIVRSIQSNLNSLDSIIQAEYVSNVNNQIVTFPDRLDLGEAEGVTNLVPGQKLVDQFRSVSRATRKKLNQIDTAIGIFNSFLSQVTEPITTLNTAINYVNDVPSLTIGAINNALFRLVNSLNNLIGLPSQFVNNFVAQVKILSDQLDPLDQSIREPLQFQTYNLAAGILSYQTSQMLVTDNNASSQAQVQESQPSFDYSGQRIASSPDFNTMSVNDLELLLYLIREFIQSVIDWPFTDPSQKASARDNQNLLNMASDLRSYVDQIKLNRLTVKTISVNNIPLMLLVTSMGLPYNAAERVLKLNLDTIKNPTFVSGTVKTYVK